MRSATDSNYRGSGRWKPALAAIAAAGLFAGACAPGSGRNAALSADVPEPGDRASAAMRAVDASPLRFEGNAGQFDDQVRFATRGSGYGLFLTPDETVLRLAAQSPAAGASGKTSPPESWVLRMGLVGGRTQTLIRGEEPLNMPVNYLKGDRSAWRTGVDTYAKTRYVDAYPGIDMVLYGRDGQLEYDFVVAPGADPRQIAMRFTGAENLSLAANGDLKITGPGGVLRQKAPIIYQGEGAQRTPVEGRFELRGADQVGFAVSAFDTTRPLTIDPILDYATYLGGAGTDYGRDVAVSGDNAYLVGSTDSLDFPVRNQVQPDRPGTDVFVSKLTADGTRVVYSTYLGGGANDQGLGVAVGDGYAYVTGSTDSVDFPVKNGRFQADQPGLDAFVSKLSADGSDLIYSTYLGGGGADRAMDIAVADRTAVVTGSTDSVDFPLAAAFQTDQPGPDAFVAKLREDATGLVYSTYLGGELVDDGLSVSLDDGDAFVTGSTDSVGFPLADPFQTDQPGTDAFVTKLSGGGAMEYSTYLGGALADRALGIDADDGYAYVTGSTMSVDFPIQDRFQVNAPGGDAFVAKLGRSGSALVYSTYLGGGGDDRAMAIAVADGSAYVTGSTASVDFPSKARFQADQPGLDAFVAKLRADGTQLVYGTHLGGAGSEEGYGIAVAGGHAYVVGATDSLNFPTKNRIQANQLGIDSFITKLGA